MYRRVLFISLLSISGIAMLGTEAIARVCLVKQGGSCIFWSGSVECNLNANGVGNVQKDPKFLGCSVSSTGAGLLLCGNPGANQQASPGIQVVNVPVDFGAVLPIDKEAVDKNGVAAVTAIATVPDGQLNQLCPNTNWVALDYVPCQADIEAELTDELGNLLGSATYSCTLPNCQTLAWDGAEGFERRQYECTQVQ